MKAKRYLNRAHKGISVFLAVVMVFSVFTGMGSFTANAAAEEAEVYMIVIQIPEEIGAIKV